MQGIYYIKNTETGTIYVGKTGDIAARHGQHRRNLRDNIHGNTWLQDDFNDYGEASFQFGIIEQTADLDAREVYWIQHHYQNSYNIQHCRPAYVSKMNKMPSILNRVRRRGIEAAKLK